MEYSVPINYVLPINGMRETYWTEFGYKLDNKDLVKEDTRIMPVGSGFLIAAKESFWPVEDLLNQYNLQIETARIFVTNPNMKLQIHRDCVSKKQQLREWAINIPIDNCDKGTNEWFSDTDNDFTDETFIPGGSAVMAAGMREYNISEVCGLDQIRLIRTDVMHRSNNIGNDKRRVVLSIRGSSHLTYNEVAKRIKEYIT